jgi:hypothetical protein
LSFTISYGFFIRLVPTAHNLVTQSALTKRSLGMNRNIRRSRQTTYPVPLNVRCQVDVHELIFAEAARRRLTPSEFSRRLLMAGLDAEGLTLPDPHRA